MFYSIPSLSQYAALEVVNPRFTVAKEAVDGSKEPLYALPRGILYRYYRRYYPGKMYFCGLKITFAWNRLLTKILVSRSWTPYGDLP